MAGAAGPGGGPCARGAPRWGGGAACTPWGPGNGAGGPRDGLKGRGASFFFLDPCVWRRRGELPTLLIPGGLSGERARREAALRPR